MHLVAGLVRILEIDRVDLEQCKVPLAFLRAPDLTFHRIAGAQGEAPDLARADIDVIGAGKIIRIRRAQEAEAVLQHLDDPLADDLDFARCQALQDGEHQFLLAQRAGILNLQLFGNDEKLGRGFFFKGM